jgi:hypothetical protein
MSNSNRRAVRLSDLFADDRLNPIELAQDTVMLFTPAMNARLHQWIRWHTHKSNGHSEETLPEIDLDNLEKIG